MPDRFSFGSLRRRELEARVGSVRDAFGPRASVLEAGPGRGLRALDLTTGAGLDATLLVDRACDLYELRWQGVPIGFHGAPGAGDAALYRPEQRGWLETFSGFMVTCGLRNVGPPSGPEGMHGRIAHARSDELAVSSEWNGDVFVSTVVSRHREAGIFGPNLELRRSWRIELGRAELEVRDEVTNLGFEAEHLLLLYHLNAGFPLVGAGATVSIDADPAPRDDDARGGLATWSELTDPVEGFSEQVFFFAGASHAVLENASLGCRLSIDWDAGGLPYTTEWKHMGTVDYALGIEPGTCHPVGRERAIADGQGRLLDPGETFASALRIGVEAV